MSLRTKLVLWYTGVFGASGCLLVTVVFSLIAHRLREEQDRYLLDEFVECAKITRENADDLSSIKEQMAQEIGADRYLPLTYRLYDAAARRDLLFVGDPAFAAPLCQAAPAFSPTGESTWATVNVESRQRTFRTVTGHVDPEGHPNLVLQMGMYNRHLLRRTESLKKYLFSSLGAVVLLAAVGGWVLASRSLKPIDELVADLSHIESQNLADRLPVGPGGDEVDRLRGAINRMLERLDVAFERLQSFTADAAHELRTPLSALQCRLEVAINKPRSEADTRAALSEALDQVGELRVLIDNMLFLARMDAEPDLREVGPVALCGLLADVGEPFTLLAEQKGVSLEAGCDAAVEVEGNAPLLRRLVGNLLDNAVRYTPEGGRVVAEAARRGDACEVAVSDTGVGIAPEAIGRVFERFYRADESRSRAAGGTGLGLSIVKRIVELHRGTISIESTPGQGTTVRVSLPPAQPHEDRQRPSPQEHVT